ncbi:MAG: DUF805 domain-containing protein [Pelagibacteraceae bacterium]|jgi:uncharacterized membrane protein YhaH (DUF805 family)|nr:DUF805 domain-containing protein [Pelagibacteraceae bacterium]MDB0036019.1 DUF805 domain-containing protein [Pelagibacteraceae bacterium]
MKFFNIIKNTYAKYATFSGRATRSEFWFFVLFYYTTIFLLTFSLFFLEMNKILMWIMYAFSLGSLLPYLGVAIRRLHDSNKSAWYVLLPIVPSIVSRLEGLEWFGIVSLVISILLFSLPGDLKKNKYGPVITVEKKSVKKKTKANNKKKKK